MPVSVSKLSRSLSEYLNRAAYGSERIVITSRGNPKAAIVSIDDLRRLQGLERVDTDHVAQRSWDMDESLEDRESKKAELAIP